MNNQYFNQEDLYNLFKNYIIFLTKATTIKFYNYNLKNIPSSTGRADVIIRYIRSVFNQKIDRLHCLNEEKFGFLILFNENFINEIWNFWNNNSSCNINFGILITNISKLSKKYDKLENLSEFFLVKNFYNSIEKLNFLDERDKINEYISKKGFFIVKVDNYIINYIIFFNEESKFYDLIKETCNIIIIKEDANINLNKIIIQKNLCNYKYNTTENFSLNQLKKNNKKGLCFILGDHIGFDEIMEKNLKNCIEFNIGDKNYLGSQVISFIKFVLYNLK